MQTKEINQLKNEIENILNNNKALEITSINLKNKTSIADFMIIASGNSSKHIQALSETLVDELKKKGINNCRLEGRDSSDWKLIDAIDIIIHIFHPEKRKFYDLEKFHKWNNWKKIPKFAKIAIFPRQNYSIKSLKTISSKKLNKKDWLYINSKKINISSSLIRKF